MELAIDRISLYKRDAAGSLQVWSIWAQNDEIWIEWGQEDGELQCQSELIEEGKASRTIQEQVLSRVNSRVEKKLDKGYVRDRNHALTHKPVNRLGLPRPMLAKPFDKVKKIDYSTSWLQFKYDGHRCLIHHISDDEYIAYSRNGKPITTITEILRQVRIMHLPDGFTLDGELYRHDESLQKITSWVKRRQLATETLVYMVYDVITPYPVTFTARLHILNSLNWPVAWNLGGHPYILKAPTVPCVPPDEISIGLKNAIDQGYEGLILRRNTAPYEDGKRSMSLVKIKKFIDDEFLVVDIIPSREGFAVLQCIAKNGKRFGATAPGTVDEKFDVMEKRDQYIGRHIQLQYAGLTDEGKPFHPTAVRWREIRGE
jgi:ATP-dependent DNA ligase